MTVSNNQSGGAHLDMPKYQKQYHLQLFVAGNESNSVRAKENLLKICNTYIDGQYDLTIIDILKNFELAIEHGVLVTPMLIIKEPAPETTIVGCLSDTEKLKAALRILS